MNEPKKPPGPPPHKCGRCPARWSGANVSHCTACHHTFTGVAPFDAHWVNSGTTGRCDVNVTDRDGYRRLVPDKRGYWGGRDRG